MNNELNMRWKPEAEEALSRKGFKVIDVAGVDDYQGWGALLGKSDDGAFAVLSWSYGSCSGCDAYEDMGDEQRATEFDGLIEIAGQDETTARALFDSRKSW